MRFSALWNLKSNRPFGSGYFIPFFNGTGATANYVTNDALNSFYRRVDVLVKSQTPFKKG
jgi:hypothetical protein